MLKAEINQKIEKRIQVLQYEEQIDEQNEEQKSLFFINLIKQYHKFQLKYDLYVGDYGAHGLEELVLKQFGNLVVFVKLTGDPNVPEGKPTIFVRMDEDFQKGYGNIFLGDTGFENPRKGPCYIEFQNQELGQNDQQKVLSANWYIYQGGDFYFKSGYDIWQKNYQYQAEIDPLTGGLVFTEEEKEESQFSEIQSKIKNVKASTYNVNATFDPIPSQLGAQDRFNLIKSFADEIIQEDELLKKLQENTFLRAYDGFEPSGRMHIAQGILRAINVNKLVDAGFIFLFWVADWFAMLNNKMGGDLEKIRLVGRYFIEVWKAAGMKMHNVKFLWASEEINKKPDEYWFRVLNIARHFSNTRITRCQQIMGREESGDLKVAQMFYPVMQCADIFFLKADVCSLGKDQRKVNMLAREYAVSNKEVFSPCIVSHGMLSGLKEGQEKMSKSHPDSAIFMEDSADDVNKKIKKAFCPEKIEEKNPILDYCKTIIFPAKNRLLIERTEQNGGNVEFATYEKLRDQYVEGQIHPVDLKKSVAKAINELLEPVRQHFENDPEAKQLLATIRSFQVTR
ncbi:hypothetical protein PPERSA_07392 [Pseudocohnilembus persalinus]|uniref:tyrosine--tRNA ligase n=1 Tax=Pseudocohnilembus persalinus TaxID=266149 RepID=A0A0V0QA80_PSEPJ|nr:hypothetical protein PPERSA_07392 [Pseudocohnilembus persalinus]|eukprot:KRW99149.1 hypothetical protein PPERSA_07392 [Pseudocohnilembus persalinus]